MKGMDRIRRKEERGKRKEERGKRLSFNTGIFFLIPFIPSIPVKIPKWKSRPDFSGRLFGVLFGLTCMNYGTQVFLQTCAF